jgi:thymidylate synthase ThyX
VVRTEYARLFPARARKLDLDAEPRWRSAIKKRCQEVARYVLPVATHAHLYHTISGLTLHRYHRLARQIDVPDEARVVIELMVAEVERWDPLFFREIEDPIPLEQTHEAEVLETLGDAEDHGRADRFVAAFDARLGGRTAALTDATSNPEEAVARAVRNALGLSDEALSTTIALDLVLDPAADPYLSNSLTLTTLGKLTRALSAAHFSFDKKLSHTADSQDQRHRMVPGARPILARQVRLGTPDYVVPALIEAAPAAVQARYRDTMEATWTAMERVLRLGASLPSAMYLLPNAFPIRFSESGDLLHLHHKWTTRLCYTAQEEIWRASLEEVQAVAARAPRLARWLAAPCTLRHRAGVRPVCPEGDRFCGVKVWQLELDKYQRLI